MGLFSSRKVNVVATSTTRVIPDEWIPNSAMAGTINAIINNENISESILDQVFRSIGVKADRLYNFGKDKYIFGLPSGQIQAASQGRAEAQAVLQGIEGSAVTILYSRIGAANLLHQGWMYLIQNHSYNPQDNTLQGFTVDHGWGPVPMAPDFDTNVYLDDLNVVVDDIGDVPEMTEMWGTPPQAGYSPSRPLHVDGAFDALTSYSPIIKGSFDGVRLTYAWEIYAGMPPSGEAAEDYIYKPQYRTATVDIPSSVDQDGDYIHVKYEVAGKTKYWMYKLGTGTYPTLDAYVDAPLETSGTYFPFAYFRFNKERMDVDKDSREYKDSKKFTKYLGLNYDDVVDAIHDTEGRDAAQVNDLESAMLVMAIPANSNDPTDLAYLWEFMDRWFYHGEGKYMDPSVDFMRLQPNQQYQYEQDGLPITKTSIVIEDKKFKMALKNGGIYKTTKAKRIGPIGTIKSERGETWTEREVRRGGSVDDYYYVKEKVPVMTHVYSKQITSEYVEEICVISMEMLYYVWGKYTSMANDDEDILLIPIDKSITDSLNILRKEELFARSLHFLFHTRQVISIKWYQTTFWSMIIMIVVAVVTVIIGGSDGGSLLAAAVAGSSAAAAIIINALVLNLLTSMAFQFAFTIAAEELGINASVFLAVLALAAGSYNQITSAASGVASAPWANTLLQVGNGLQQGIMGAIDSILEDLNTELEAIATGYQEDMDALAQVNRELAGQTNRINPFVIFGESPDDFYNRTVHSGNIGLQGIEMVTGFVDNALRLPALSQTIDDQGFPVFG